MTKNISKPIPSNVGVGIFCFEEHPEYEAMGLRPEKVGRYFNYHFTTKCWEYPIEDDYSHHQYVIDGFSPNLNKHLHIGHFRNLLIAATISHLLPHTKMVAMIGTSLGTIDGAISKLKFWQEKAKYTPHWYPEDQLPHDLLTLPGQGAQTGCQVWMGPKGPVIVKRSDGRFTYEYHDLVFQKMLNPDYYITGMEQKEHFAMLGLTGKHLPMGLVLDSSGKKIASRNGGALSIDETISLVSQNMANDKKNKDNLSWNIIAWNFLKSNRNKNLIFDPLAWSNTNAPGMYISYTYARVASALKMAKINQYDFNNLDLHSEDIRLLGFSSYWKYYQFKSIEKMDPSFLATFTLELAKEITGAYHREMIRDLRPGFIHSVKYAMNVLETCMNILCMNLVEEV